MKAFRNLFCIVFATLISFLTACEQDINIKLPYAGDKIVLNAILVNDSLVYAHITKSASSEIDVDSFAKIRGAVVELYENDISKGTLTEAYFKGEPFYVSSIRVKNSNKYTIKVSYQGLTSVEGSDVIPAKPSFVPVEYWKTNNSTDSLKPYKMTVKIKDPPGVKNYYRMRIFPANYNNTTRRYSVNKNSELYFGIDNFIDGENIFNSFDDNLNRINYFTDETFDGQEVTLTLSLRVMNNERIYVAPELAELSYAAYHYFDSKEKQDDNYENPFTEAVVVYNNIQNGYGIVGGIADSVAIIRRRN